MAKTAADVISIVRREINDVGGVRVNATDMLRHYNDALRDLYNSRPSIFVSTINTAIPTEATALDSVVPYEDQFINAHANLVVARIERRAQEGAAQTRAANAENRGAR